MFKKVFLTTTICLALSACGGGGGGSSSSNDTPEPEILAFSNLDAVTSVARAENTAEAEHLIGFDKTGAEFEISNYGVDAFTPTSDGGLVVKVTENHKAEYLYPAAVAPVDDGENSPEEITASAIVEALTADTEEIPITETMRRPVWYYVTPTGDYYLITKKSDLPNFMGENSEGKLVFSDGLVFDTKEHLPTYFYNNIELDAASIKNAVEQIPSYDPNQTTPEKINFIADILSKLSENTIERVKDISYMKGDSFISTSKSAGTVLIDSTEAASGSLDDSICDSLDLAKKTICKNAVVPAINKLPGLIGFNHKTKNLTGVTQALPIPESDFTLLNTGLLDYSKPDTNQPETSIVWDWDGETALTSLHAFVLSSEFDGQTCQYGMECLFTAKKVEKSSGGIRPTTEASLDITPTIELSEGFEIDSEPSQIKGGQQDYLWANDDYIVIKEASQISIIKQADKSVKPILVGTQIDTVNLTSDNLLYITATDSAGAKAMIYNLATGEQTPIFATEKLAALKGLIPQTASAE
ncbi:MAG: hypothetical protein ACK5NC_08395 [Vibrio sp.]